MNLPLFWFKMIPYVLMSYITQLAYHIVCQKDLLCQFPTLGIKTRIPPIVGCACFVLENPNICKKMYNPVSIRYIRNPNTKFKNGFKFSGTHQRCINIHSSQCFNQILILPIGLITSGLAAVVQAALDSRAACTTAAGPEVIKPVN